MNCVRKVCFLHHAHALKVFLCWASCVNKSVPLLFLLLLLSLNNCQRGKEAYIRGFNFFFFNFVKVRAGTYLIFFDKECLTFALGLLLFMGEWGEGKGKTMALLPSSFMKTVKG